ncbi:hypothetical protein WSM22_34650 [Cytophagales bacterium WSM2-2]|nr:hypothetical protein WSM22_34650 [Cytophagales bacterium WSM2-2]
MRLTVFCLCLSFVISQAQTITHTSITISTEGTNIFPLFKSATKPRVAATINRALQIFSFNHTNVEKNPGDYEDTDRYSKWNYTVDYSNDRLLRVTLLHFFPKQSMNTPDRTENVDFWFDTNTGDKVQLWYFISREKLPQMKSRVADIMEQTMRKRHAELVKKFPPKDFGKALPKLEENIARMRTEITNPDQMFDGYNVNDKTFTFYSYWTVDDYREEMEADLDQTIIVVFGPAELKPFTSDFWSYYILRTSTTPPTPDPITHMWSGMIGGKIPVTFMITSQPGSTDITGFEVYDNYGGTLTLKGGVRGTSYWIDEADEKGVKTGSFEFTSVNGKLKGTWKNGNGTKSMDFKAVIGGSDLP